MNTQHTHPPTVIHNARLVGLDGADPGVLACGSVLVENGVIADVGRSPRAPDDALVIDAEGRVVMPAFVDCHTHACWAGDRLDEWDAKRRGASYLELLHAGGGIMSTVRAVRAASEEQLAADLLGRLRWMLAEGTTTVEVKSGYGLTTEDELKMLRSIAAAGSAFEGTVVPTACIGHAIDPEQPDHVERVIAETLPAVTREFPGIAVDAYCEDGAWTRDQCVRLFEAAMAGGHPMRVHADQFNDLGLISDAVRLGAVSVDHLEASTPEHLDELGGSDVTGVVLPCSGFHVDQRYADARRLIDAGGTVAIGTNWNPGSAPSGSMPLAIALAVRNNGLSPHEAIAAATANGARVLGFSDRGRLAPGLRADLVMLRHRDERLLAYEFGGRQAVWTMCGGRIITDEAGRPS